MAPLVNTLIIQLRELLSSVAGQVNLCLYILSTEIFSQNILMCKQVEEGAVTAWFKLEKDVDLRFT
jgi:hypothetical protein